MLQARGLATFNNYLSAVPEGALIKANNVVIDRTGVIEPRRGFKQYSILNQPPKQLLKYREKLLVHYDDILAYDDGTGTLSNYLEPILETEVGLRLKFIEENGNLYLTTSTGIKKLSALNDLSIATIEDAGGIKALTGQGIADYSLGTGFLPGLSKVAYRLTWGTKDINDNFIEGAPSPVVEVINQSTENCNIIITFDVPNAVTSNYFYRLYRTDIFTATTLEELPDIRVNDELRLVFEEAYVSGPTVTITDVTPRTFRDSGPPLYTNEFSGEGILQSNTPPPFAKDIVTYKGYTFYGNTKQKHSSLITVLGTTKFTSFGAVEDSIDIVSIVYSAPDTDITFSSSSHGITIGQNIVVKNSGASGLDDLVHTVVNVSGAVITITADGTGANAATSTIHSSYLTITKDTTENNYYFVGRKEINQLTFDAYADATERSAKYPETGLLKLYSSEDEVEYALWFAHSPTSTPPAFTGGILIKVEIYNTSATNIQVAEAVFTALSENSFDFEYVVNTPAGTLEVQTARSGSSTNPIIDPLLTGITNINIQEGYGEDITKQFVRLPKFLSAGLSIDDLTRSLCRNINSNVNEEVSAFYIFNSADLPGRIQLEARVLDDVSFTVLANSVDVGSSFNPVLSPATTSTNETFQNRIYYSKFRQPEAVPIVNFIDVGSKNKPIDRIVSLRDNLFIFKSEGIYKLSGDTPNTFFLGLQDSSAFLVAPDALSVLNNQIMAFTTQGVVQISDSGVGIISRSIEDTILKVIAPAFTNTKTLSFSTSSESDRTFFLWLPESTSSTFGDVCYRYNIFTQTWTTMDRTARCAIDLNSRLYIGAGDLPQIEQERKNLNKTDFADRVFDVSLLANFYSGSGSTIKVGSIANIERGDVLVQRQYVTIAIVNQLAQKLAQDPGVPQAAKPFYQNFILGPGVNLQNEVQTLITQLNTDLGTSFDTIFNSDPLVFQLEYNSVILDLNLAPELIFSNYKQALTAIDYEFLVESVNIPQLEVTGLAIAPFVVGEIEVNKAINSDVIYSAISFGDPAVMKHIRSGTIMFANADLAFASLGYSTDLSPNYENISFQLEGDGSWGVFFYNSTTWGGEGTQRPFRTLIPRQKQRCRFIRPRFIHKTAFYKFMIFGVSFDYEVTNTRAYK
jgi:hypothetical protein